MVLVLAAAITGLLGLGLPRLAIDATIESMLVEGHADQLAFEAHKAVFGNDERVSVAIPFDRALSAQSLHVQARVALALEALPDVAAVDALTTVDDIRGTNSDLVVEPLVPDFLPSRSLTTDESFKIETRVSMNPVWVGSLISADRQVAAMQVELNEDASVDAIQHIETALTRELGDAPYYLAGHPFMKSEIASTMQRDLAAFLPIAIAVMFAALAAAVRSPRLVVAVLAAVLLCEIWMLGAMGWLGLPVTALSNTAPTILIALATAYFMHMTAAYQQEQTGMRTSTELAAVALARVRRPTFVAGATTVVGFASLGFSDVPLIAGFGLALALGIAAVVFQACLVLPALLALFGPVTASARGLPLRKLDIALFGIARICARNPRNLLCGAVVIFLAACVVASNLSVDSSGPNTFPEDSRFRNASKFYQTRLSGDVIENLYVKGDKQDVFKKPETLQALADFQQDAERLPQIRKTVSIADYIKLMNRAVHDDDPAMYALPRSREAVAQYLLLYSMSGDIDEFDELVDPSYEKARVVMYAEVASSKESAELRAELAALAAVHLRDFSSDVLSTEILLSQAADTLVVEQVQSFGIALTLILALVAFAFRTRVGAAVLLLPNLMPIGVTLAGMTILGMPVNQSTAVLGVVALGLAVDGTVHLLATAIASERIHGNRDAAVAMSVLRSGRPIALTSGVVAAGFAVLLISDFKVVAELGGLIAITMLLCLVADLFLVPVQILAMGRSRLIDSEMTALLTFPKRSYLAICLRDRVDGAVFRILGAESSWLGVESDRVSIRWLRASGVVDARFTAYEDVAIPVIHVQRASVTSGHADEA